MSSIYTKAEKVTGTVAVWAVPKYKSEMVDGEPPFRYELSTGHVWTRGAVKVAEYDNVTLDVPAGVNLVARAIKTLEEEREKAHEDYLDKAKVVDEQIAELKLLAGPAPDDSLEGECEEL